MNILKETLLKYRVAIFLGTVAVCISMVFGFLYYSNEKRDVIKRKYSELHAITDYKMDMISTWLKERTNDVMLIRTSPLIGNELYQLQQNPGDSAIRSTLIERFGRVKTNFGYKDIIVVDETGFIIAKTDSVSTDESVLQKKIKSLDTSIAVSFTGIYRPSSHDGYHFDIIIPLERRAETKRLFLAFRTDPEIHLFPILVKWPVSSQSGESFIATRDSDSVSIFSPLRFRGDAPLNFKVSTELEQNPVVFGSRGYEGTFRGLDYRGIDVLSVIRKTPLTNWIFVAKVDVEEVVADIAKDTVLLSTIIGLSLMTLFIGLGYYFSSKNSMYLSTILKAEQELNKLGQEFKTIFYSIGDGVITTDSDGKIRQMNQVAERLTGWTLSEAGGKNIQAVFHILNEETRHKASNPVEEVMKTGDVVKSVEYTLLIKRSGEEIPVSHNASPIHDLKTGDLTGVVLVFKDRTEIRNRERELALSEEKFSKAFYTSPDAILITELESSKVVDYNQGLLEITGHTDDEVSGNTAINLRLLPSPEYRNRLAEHIKNIGSVKNMQIEFIHKDGTTKYGLISASIIDLHGEKHFISITRDITDRVRLEMELIEAKERAEEANKAKSSFFSNMSHELRTPLHGVMGFTEVLQDMVTDQEILDVIGAIHRSGVRLMGTLNLILDLARVESGKEEVRPEKLVLANVVKEDFESFRAFAQGKGLDFAINCENPETGIFADRRLLDSIVNNLLNNAIKFTHHGEVRIETGFTLVEGVKRAFIKVSDTGIGISADALDMVFEEFRQASEGFDRQFEGTGLGLSIVKKYVDLLDGTIRVESKLGFGTVFTITLPYCEVDLSASVSETEERRKEVATKAFSPEKRKLLFLEDDDASIYFTTKVLTPEYEVVTFKTAERALQTLEEGSYDAFLIDISLGKGMSGIDFVQKIKDEPRFTAIPRVAITAYAMSGQEGYFIKYGFTHYLAKPFTKDELRQFIDSIFVSNTKDRAG